MSPNFGLIRGLLSDPSTPCERKNSVQLSISRVKCNYGLLLYSTISCEKPRGQESDHALCEMMAHC